MAGQPAIEHGSGPVSRWLRANRLKVALAVGVAETITIVATHLSWWSAVLLAGIIFALHIGVGRKAKSELARQLSWTAAGSQVLPVVVPAVVVLVSAIVVAVVVIIVVIAVVIAAMLFIDRK